MTQAEARACPDAVGGRESSSLEADMLLEPA